MQTNNTDWGFYGTIRHHADPDEAWPVATEAVHLATGCPESAARDFLDSRHGRHFADDVADGLVDGLDIKAAIDASVARWMGWKIDRRIERQQGILRGLPYLTGFVALHETEGQTQLH